MGLFDNPGASVGGGGGLFGQPPASAPASNNLFGGGIFGAQAQSQQQQQQPPKPNLFGGAPAAAAPATGGLFGSAPAPGQQAQQQQQQPQGSGGASLFGAPKPAGGGGGLFGHPAIGGASLFGQPQSQQPAPAQPQQQPAQQQQQQQGNFWGGQQGPNESRIGSIIGSAQVQPRQKSVPEQIATIAQKWTPQTGNNFSAYLYNAVPPEQAPFYRPGPDDDEEAWEAALARAPSGGGAIPVRVRGFLALGRRAVQQREHLRLLQGRLHEVADGLADLLRRHELEVAARAAAARRTHARLAGRALALAARAQILRGRGYALDAPEEALRTKLAGLEKRVFDPALAGREEEVWARMVTLRERGRGLEAEARAAGAVLVEERKGEKIDEEVLKRAKKILEDYDQQLAHLAVEVKQIRDDFEAWEKGRPDRANGQPK